MQRGFFLYETREKKAWVLSFCAGYGPMRQLRKEVLMYTTGKKERKGLARVLALILVLTLTVMPAEGVLAATKTKTISMPVIETKGILKILDYYGKDNFQVTYDTGTKQLVQVKTSKSIKNPEGCEIIERDKSITRKKTSAKKWKFVTTWYLSLNNAPPIVEKLVLKKFPVLEAVFTIGRFVAIKATYNVTAGKVTRTSLKVKPMVPSNLIGAAKTLLTSFLK